MRFIQDFIYFFFYLPEDPQDKFWSAIIGVIYIGIFSGLATIFLVGAYTTLKMLVGILHTIL
jgi:hypothetical protein